MNTRGKDACCFGMLWWVGVDVAAGRVSCLEHGHPIGSAAFIADAMDHHDQRLVKKWRTLISCVSGSFILLDSIGSFSRPRVRRTIATFADRSLGCLIARSIA